MTVESVKPRYELPPLCQPPPPTATTTTHKPPPTHRVHPKMRTLANVWATTVSCHTGSRHRLQVSSVVFAGCWWFLAAMHFFNGSLALVFAVIYLFFSLPAIYPTIAVIDVSHPLLTISGGAYVVLAVIHFSELLQMVRQSVHHKQLTFSPHTSALSSTSRLHRRWRSCQRSLWAPWNKLFGVEGIFGVNGEYFYAAFLAREALEILLQTYQAHQLSGSVRRAWITNLAVATVVVNSLSTPLVQRLMRNQSESARRFMSLLVDMSLDFCCAAVIPLCVVYPYVLSYDQSLGSLPVTLVGDDVLFLSSLEEIRQFCVTSLPDFFATMMPHSTVYTCLNLAKKLVQRERTDVFTVRKLLKHRRISAVIVVAQDAGDMDTDTTVAIAATVAFPSTTRREQARAVCRRRLMALFHVVVVSWTSFTLAVHLRAQSFARGMDIPGCRLSLGAWFSAGAPCSVVQINCHRDGTRGHADEIEAVLDPLDRLILKKVIFTHCESLEIPPLLAEFENLIDLDIYNSTLVSWAPEAAATSSTTLRSLATFTMFRSPYVAFPSGLLHNDLPRGFARFTIAKSNLTELPEELGALWSHHTLDIFGLQFTQLTHLPATFAEMNVWKLRLVSNPALEMIREDAFATKTLLSLHVSGCPLQSFPESIGDTSQLMEVFAEHTEIPRLSSQLQDWWDDRSNGVLAARYTLSLYGSPACTQQQQQQQENGISDSGGVCGIDHGSVNGTYRWDLIDLQRTLDS